MDNMANNQTNTNNSFIENTGAAGAAAATTGDCPLTSALSNMTVVEASMANRAARRARAEQRGPKTGRRGTRKARRRLSSPSSRTRRLALTRSISGAASSPTASPASTSSAPAILAGQQQPSLPAFRQEEDELRLFGAPPQIPLTEMLRPVLNETMARMRPDVAADHYDANLNVALRQLQDAPHRQGLDITAAIDQILTMVGDTYY